MTKLPNSRELPDNMRTARNTTAPPPVHHILREPSKKNSVKVGILFQPAWSLPLPRTLGFQKRKEKSCLFCILGYSKHIIFHEKSNFFGVWWFLCDFYVIFGDFLVGTGEPLTYCGKIPTKSPFSEVVVLKSWDWVRPFLTVKSTC